MSTGDNCWTEQDIPSINDWFWFRALHVRIDLGQSSALGSKNSLSSFLTVPHRDTPSGLIVCDHTLLSVRGEWVNLPVEAQVLPNPFVPIVIHLNEVVKTKLPAIMSNVPCFAPGCHRLNPTDSPLSDSNAFQSGRAVGTQPIESFRSARQHNCVQGVTVIRFSKLKDA